MVADITSAKLVELFNKHPIACGAILERVARQLADETGLNVFLSCDGKWTWTCNFMDRYQDGFQTRIDALIDGLEWRFGRGHKG